MCRTPRATPSLHRYATIAGFRAVTPMSAQGQSRKWRHTPVRSALLRLADIGTSWGRAADGGSATGIQRSLNVGNLARPGATGGQLPRQKHDDIDPAYLLLIKRTLGSAAACLLPESDIAWRMRQLVGAGEGERVKLSGAGSLRQMALERCR